MDKHKILKINFSNFPEDDSSAQIPGKLFLIDNFSEPLPYQERDEIMRFPVQVTMSLIIICRCGTLNVKVNMKNYTVHSGDCMSIVAGSFFQMLDVSDDIECCMLAINPQFIDFVKDVKMGLKFAYAVKASPLHHLEYYDMQEMISIYSALKHKLYQKNYRYKEEVAKNYLNILQCNAFQHFSNEESVQEPEKPSNRKEEIFMEFISQVQKHYMTERNVTFYASKLCMTPKYLSAVIHEVSEKYATQWINEYVILEAKKMLRGEGRSVKDVCNTLNFANQSFFAKYFKQHTGYTPKEYKNLS